MFFFLLKVPTLDGIAPSYSGILINKGGRIMETENHHLANTAAVIVAGENHQGVLKLVVESMMRNRIFAESLSISPQCIYKLKREYSNFTVE